MSFFGIFGRRMSLGDVFDPRKKVKVHGIPFTIRKLNPLDHLCGSKALVKLYDTYQKTGASTDNIDQAAVDRVKMHYSDVFMGAVVSVGIHGVQVPLSRKIPEPSEKKLFVGNLLTDWALAEELYSKISEFTYGKKKFLSRTSQKTS